MPERNEAIIEIRAGAGGEEAALFASELFNMYKRYALSKGWGFEAIDSNRTDIGGFKSLVFEMRILKEVIYSFGIETARSANKSMYTISFFQ